MLKSILLAYLAAMVFGDIYTWFILIASLTACTIYFDKKAAFALKLFPFFLFATFCVETIGIRMSNNGFHTMLLYNVFTTVEFAYYFWLFATILHQTTVKKILYNLIWLFPLLALLNKLFIQKGLLVFLSFTYSFGCLLIVAAAIMYFYELFQIEKSVDLIRERTFWISSGLLFFYTCSFPLFAVTNFFSAPTSVFRQNYNTISSLLNILLYSSFIIASLCRIRIRKFFL